jgi:hypothetical protein
MLQHVHRSGSSVMPSLLLCCFVVPAVVHAAAPDVRIDPLVQKIQQEIKPQEAMDYLHRLYTTDRWFTFPKFQETAEYVQGVLKEIGLSDVELLNAPADGVTQYGFWTMPLAWDAKRATLEIVEPAVPEPTRLLADYQKLPCSLGMWSGPTPPEGITAEVVEMTSEEPADWEKIDMKGKLVMTRPCLLPETKSLKWILVKKGALGAINAFTENPSLKDGVQWMNFWGDSGWAFTKTSTPLLCFSISPKQSDFIHALLAEHRTVRVKAVADTRYYSGAYPYVTGVLRGTSGAEEVLQLGHMSEQGASDNCTGVSAMLEAVATLNRLIVAGKLPRPQRGIRLLTMGEMYPSMHYVATHPERMRNTVAAICMDTAAGPYELAGTEYTFHLNPDVARSYVDPLIGRIAEAYFPHLDPPRPYHVGPYHTGTDEYLCDPMISVPTLCPLGGTGVHTHHNSEDTPDRVDPRSLRDYSLVAAAFLYITAASGETQVPWLAEMAADHGYQQILAAGASTRDRLLTAAQGAELGPLLQAGLDRIAYTRDRETEGVRSVLRLVPDNRRVTLQTQLDPLLQRLSHFAEEQSTRLRDAANRRAAALGTATPVEPPTAATDPQLAEAAHIVIKRKRLGTIPMDDLPVEQWEGFPYGSWDLVPVTALYWCDGKRTLAEVIRRTRMEYDAADFDFVGYFRFLAKHGYVELRSGQQ